MPPYLTANLLVSEQLQSAADADTSAQNADYLVASQNRLTRLLRIVQPLLESLGSVRTKHLLQSGRSASRHLASQLCELKIMAAVVSVAVSKSVLQTAPSCAVPLLKT
jgi:hypothetical protein